MSVELFLSVFIVITILYFINKLRIFQFNVKTLLHWLKWYTLFLLVYYSLSSNQFYLEDAKPQFLDFADLGIVFILSIAMIVYVDQYCKTQQRNKKLKEVEAIYAEIEAELRVMNQQMQQQRRDKS